MSASDWLTHAVPLDDFDVDALLDREWLCTNGTGAYAMGTAAGCNTRRYHGLFVASRQPPVGRIAGLNQVLESLLLFDETPEERQLNTQPKQALDFSGCLFTDRRTGRRVIEPAGWSMLRRFDRRISVIWVYGWGRIALQRELRLHWKQQAVTLRYRLTGLHKHCNSALLKLAPMLTLRDFHGMMRADQSGDDPISVRQHTSTPDAVTFSDGYTAVTIQVPGARFLHEPQWWYDIHYPRETDRGQEDREDQRIPGRFEIELPPNPKVDLTLTVALGDRIVEPVINSNARAAHLKPMLEHLNALGPSGESTTHSSDRSSQNGAAANGVSSRLQNGSVPHPDSDSDPIIPADYGQPSEADADPDLQSPVHDRLVRSLAIAADDFVVDRTMGGQDLSTILAGYPWFADWGRDTFIALPGLLISTGRYEEARKVLQTFAGAIRRGLLPNRFDDYDDQAAHYNTVDASMWFVTAALAYVKRSGDQASWREWLAPAVMSILDAYETGTDHGIRMDTDGLITAGTIGTQLTWMDAAAVNDRGEYVVFTPRHGKAVEINALWHAGLAGTAEALKDLGDPTLSERAAHYAALAERVRAAYTHAFWNDEDHGLFDHLTPSGGRDDSIRPNQIFAVSLAHSPLAPDKQRAVWKAVRRHLLTPAGLRTLPVDDPRYHKHYRGPQFYRDEAYHQGTIWPWLIGPYAEATLRVGNFSSESRQHAWAAIRPLVDRLLDDGLGQINEVHEADPPHRPVGCIAQAWSVSEVIRVMELIRGGDESGANAAARKMAGSRV